MKFYPRYTGDYLRDTMHLTLAEHGAFTLLLDTYYATERPLPADHAALFRLCHAMSEGEQQAVSRVADEFFPVGEDGKRHNARADAELRKAEAMRDGGRAGAAKRWGNRGVNVDGNRGAISPANTLPYAIQSQNQNHIQDPEPQTLLPRPTGSVAKKQGGSLKSVETPTTSNEGTGRVWAAYAEAYGRRYAVEPVRNAKVNAQIRQLVERIGLEDAVGVAGFFPGHNNAYYTGRGHAVGIMLADAEKLRTEWATGRRGTQVEARNQDRRQGLANAFAPLIAEAASREERREEPAE